MHLRGEVALDDPLSRWRDGPAPSWRDREPDLEHRVGVWRLAGGRPTVAFDLAVRDHHRRKR